MQQNDKSLAIFVSISVISGRWVGDNKRVYAREPRKRLKPLRLMWGWNRDHKISA